ncbi:MAG: S-layer homology domain-containing protein [Clostridia bacterium]|nr:S-layer homology domain-containing protein [Clostridia bacterium]
MKKLLLTLIFILALSFVSVTALAFDDMPNDWSTAALQSAVDNGLLQGTDNKLLPKNNLTRAQMATILVRALGATESADISSFTDVPKNAWYYNNMAIAFKMNIFRGDGAGKMNPDANITRQEAFVVLARAYNLTTSDYTSLSKFKDADKIASWAKPELAALVKAGYVAGSNGMLNPLSSITRAEFAQVMYNLNKAYVDSSSELSALGVVNGNVIIRDNSMTKIENLTVNGDVIIGDGMKALASMKNVKINGRLVIRCSGNVSFDGEASEMVLVADNTTVTASSTSKISKITKSSETSSVKTESEIPSTPTTPTVPTTPTTPEVEEDLWTDFH